VRAISARRRAELIRRREAVMLVAARDQGRCVLCGSPDVECHECIPRSAFGSKTKDACYQERNMICICQECHGKVHNPAGRRMLFGRLAERYGYVYNAIETPWAMEYLTEEEMNA